MKKKELKKQIRDCKKDIQKLIGYSLDKVKIIKSLKQELETLRSANHDMHRQLVEAGKRTDEIKGSNPDDNLQYQVNSLEECLTSQTCFNHKNLIENLELKKQWRELHKELANPKTFMESAKEGFTKQFKKDEIEMIMAGKPTALQALEELRGLDNEKKIVKNRRKESISERKARHQAILDGIVPFEELRGIEPTEPTIEELQKQVDAIYKRDYTCPTVENAIKEVTEPVKGVLVESTKEQFDEFQKAFNGFMDNVHSPKRLAEVLGLESTGEELETKKSPEHNPEDLSINNKP